MTLKNEVKLIETELAVVKSIFAATVNLISSFNITDKKVLPYCLRAHTRSISQVVEKVITQQAKFHAAKIGVTDVDFDIPDTCLHDCIIDVGENCYFVNVKIHNVEGKHNKNNPSTIAKFFIQYDYICSNQFINRSFLYWLLFSGHEKTKILVAALFGTPAKRLGKIT